MSPKILIIGSGVTGALCSASLSRAFPLATVTVWDKARGAGGRMTTTRTDNGHKADLGAQYITTSKANLDCYDREYQTLISKGILLNLVAPIEGMKPYPADVVHFVAPDGMGSVVKTILGESKAPVFFNRHVDSILIVGDKYKVTTQDGSSEECDVLISTIPVPQFLNLPGAESLVSENELDKLRQVKYSTRFVLVWFYNDNNAPNVEWGSKYLKDDVIRFVSVDNIKRDKRNEPVAIVFHSSIEYGESNKLKTRTEMMEELHENAKRLFPNWASPSSTKCHKWLYSQVVNGFENTEGCITLTDKPMLILAGDAFTESNFNGCISSARGVVNSLKKAYN